MRYMKGTAVIFGITMLGEFCYSVLPFPVPAGVYGLFLLLLCLCIGAVKLETVAVPGDLLLELMPLMFIPAGAGLMGSVGEVSELLLPYLVIIVLSTVFVLLVTGWVAQGIIRKTGGGRS